MISSLTNAELTSYVKSQLDHHFPDQVKADEGILSTCVNIALERLECCISAAALNRYKKDGQPYFDHLFGDSYMLFLCYLANTVWQHTQDHNLSAKVYSLNKLMHCFDCMYDNKLPKIFLIIHGFGTMMGKAVFGEYFVIYQGCTIGASNGIYPVIGRGVTVTANSSVIGKTSVGNRSVISTRTTVYQKDIPADSTVFINFDSGQLQVKPSKQCYTQQFFNVNLTDNIA